MRILILTQFYPPEMGGAAARLSGMARWLVKFGHQVTVMTGLPNYPSGVVFAPYKGKRRVVEVIDGVEIIRTWVYASAYKRSIFRMASYVSFFVSSTLSALFSKRRFDVILASSPPPFVGLTALFISRFWRIPWVFDLRDLWPDVFVEAGMFGGDSMNVKFWNHLSRYMYNRAAHLTPVTVTKCQKLLDIGVPAQKITVVSNGVDLEMISESSEHFRKDLGLDKKFIVFYAGLIGIAQGLDKLLVPTAQALMEHENICFVVIGDGVKKPELERKIKTLSLENVILLPQKPKRLISSFLISADVSLVPLISSEIRDAVPSKLMEAWAHEKPVILVAGGEAAELVRRCDGGVVVPPEAPNLLVDAVLDLASDHEKCGKFAANGRSFVEKYFDRRDLARKMETVLYSVAEQDCIKTHQKI